jgi:hypothetical protein
MFVVWFVACTKVQVVNIEKNRGRCQVSWLSKRDLVSSRYCVPDVKS